MPAWSISAEWLVYILFPLLLWALLKRSTGQLLIIFTLAILGLTALYICLFNYSLDKIQGPNAIYRCFLEFLMGLVLYRLAGLHYLKTLGHPLSLLTLGTLTGILLHFNVGDIWVVPVFSLLIIGGANGYSLSQAVLSNTVLHHLGKISYSIYLVHMVVYEYVKQLCEIFLGVGLKDILLTLESTIVAALILALGVISIAHVTYHWVEKPMRIQIKEWLLNSNSKKIST